MSIKTVHVLADTDDCYGCGACYNACPAAAITMQEQNDGFLYPAINTDLCIGCDRCKAVCPRLNAKYENTWEPACYAVLADDEVRMKSSSGGMFTLLANYILERGGAVCGAEFSEDYMSVRHIVSDKAEDISKMRKSKYLQSDTGKCYQMIQELLARGSMVMFTGCPCQVAGLKSFLGEEASCEKLLLVDTACHAVPSPGAWRVYLDGLCRNRELREVNFRPKDKFGWHAGVCVCAAFSDGAVISGSDDVNIWMRAFLEGISTRNSCGTCQFARLSRQGDLTIADFWGISAHAKKYDDDKGTSLVLVNNEKAQRVMDDVLKDQCVKVADHVPLSWISVNRQLYSMPHTHPGNPVFKAAIHDGADFASAAAKAKGLGLAKPSIALLTWWFGKNYGAMLTAFALYRTVTAMGYSASMIDYAPLQNNKTDSFLDIPGAFAYKHYSMTKVCRTENDLRELNSLYDTFLVGSDQQWTASWNNQAKQISFLNFVHEGKRKVSYATSFGQIPFCGVESKRYLISYLLNRFDAISVREEDGVAICRDLYNAEATHVLDPVFLCKKEDYIALSEAASLANNRAGEDSELLTAYILDASGNDEAVLAQLAEKLDVKINPICSLHKADSKDKRLTPEDWLYSFLNSKYIITDSFHGLCFAILFNKPFVCIVNTARGASRFTSLARILQLEERLVESIMESSIADILVTPIDYAFVNAKLDMEKARCIDWLRNALSAPKQARCEISDFDITSAAKQETEQELERLRTRMRTGIVGFLCKVTTVMQSFKNNGIAYTFKLFIAKLHR